MRFRVNDQYGETYKCQLGNHQFHDHKETPSEYPQSTIRMKRQIISRYLRSFRIHRWMREARPLKRMANRPLLQVCGGGGMAQRAEHGDDLAFVVECVRDYVEENKCGTA